MIPRRPFNMPFISHFQIPILISHILKTLIDLSSAFCKSFNCFSPVLIKYSIRRILDLGIFAFSRNSVRRYSLNPGRPSEARISLLYRLKTDICSLLYLTGILLSIFAFCVNNTFFGLVDDVPLKRLRTFIFSLSAITKNPPSLFLHFWLLPLTLLKTGA